MNNDARVPEFHLTQFDFTTLEEELQVDQHCRSLLQCFHAWLLQGGLTPEQASERAYCVDYYLRDYLMDTLCWNILRVRPRLVRCFGGTWYIIRTMEPEFRLLEQHLNAILAWYRYLQESSLITMDEYLLVEAECSDREWYRRRVDSFLDLKADQYDAWERGCSLRSLVEEVKHV
ncbi:hypothetical protein [Trichlorobacter ammonificans]|uniref:Uncharacterized protein n=1 Tax=Trichlorobacter ammonificans TaxID=2916410 RepID=A0ABM9D9W8_9BACT|nr:hypothetical protein [Trichlorobacter ammonificans]CAH2031197.1 conserved protein of unknown function [Trichlorobacter ammonificans]